MMTAAAGAEAGAHAGRRALSDAAGLSGQQGAAVAAVCEVAYAHATTPAVAIPLRLAVAPVAVDGSAHGSALAFRCAPSNISRR